MKLRPLQVAAIASIAILSSASAATMSFGVLKDTSLVQESANNNYGSRTNVLLGPTGNGRQRAGLVAFDMGDFAGKYASITSAKVTFTVDVTTSTTGTYSINLLKEGNADWVQGSSNGAVEVGTATWAQKVNGSTAWLGGASGARLNPQDVYGALGSMTFTTGTTALGSVIEVPLDPSSLDTSVDTWTEIFDIWTGGTNGGFQIYGGTGQWSVASLENGTEAARPVLEIEYTAIPEPSGIALLGLAGIGLILRRHRR